MYLYRIDSPFKLFKMKNFTRVFSVTSTAFAVMGFLLLPSSAYSQKKTQQETLSAFPDDISAIFKNSCVGCHSDQGNGKAKIFMNLSNWSKLSAKKQSKTSKTINKQISKGNMPPAGFLEKRPQAKLTTDQSKTITAWAQSLKKK